MLTMKTILQPYHCIPKIPLSRHINKKTEIQREYSAAEKITHNLCRKIQLRFQFFIEEGLVKKSNFLYQTEQIRTVMKKDRKKGMAHLCLKSATSR